MKSIPRLSILFALFITLPLWAEAKTPPPKNLPEGATFEPDLKYGDAPGSGQLLDLYLPAKAEGSLPLIVWIHGGGWSGGSKEGCPALGMLSRGYVVASLNYRLSGEAKFPAQILDCKGAIRWLRAHAKEYHIDPAHIGIWGGSAGGHLVALLGTSADVKELEGTVGGNLDQSSRVQCVCDWFGPTDMGVFFEQADKVPNIFKADPERSPICTLFGGPLKEHVELVRQANPISS